MDALGIAKDIAKRFEGLKLKPYLCPAGVPTIGYGSTAYENGRKVTLQDPPIMKERAEVLLDGEMSRSASAAIRLCPGLIVHEKKLGAIADFVYNLGAGRLQASTLRRRINQQDWVEASKELNKWVYGGGCKLPGLVLRRAVEARYLS